MNNEEYIPSPTTSTRERLLGMWKASGDLLNENIPPRESHSYPENNRPQRPLHKRMLDAAPMFILVTIALVSAVAFTVYGTIVMVNLVGTIGLLFPLSVYLFIKQVIKGLFGNFPF